MTSKLTRERLEKIKSWRETYGAGSNVMLPAEEAEELARIALAAMESEPVAWVSSGALDSRLAGIEAVTIPFVPGMDIPLFRHPVVTHDGDCDADIFGFARRSGDLVVIDVNGDPHVRDGMPLYRHAQPAPVVPDDVLEALQKVARIHLDLDEFDGDRRGIADCLGDAEEALIEVVNRRAAMLAAAPQEVNHG
ncbi:hypothetical protein LGM12_09405 [Klebsiella pneumoniae]|nr:hypothetical protein [Klebsiella pneumoniae]UDC35617.1 hypothetical protein LGM12_09405 [Klebsiella pneumoniae]